MVTVLGGFLGTALCFRKKKWAECGDGLLLLWVSLLFLLAYVGGSTGDSTHYLWIPLALSIIAGYGIFSVHEAIAQKLSSQIWFAPDIIGGSDNKHLILQLAGAKIGLGQHSSTMGICAREYS